MLEKIKLAIEETEKELKEKKKEELLYLNARNEEFIKFVLRYFCSDIEFKNGDSVYKMGAFSFDEDLSLSLSGNKHSYYYMSDISDLLKNFARVYSGKEITDIILFFRENGKYHIQETKNGYKVTHYIKKI